MSTWTTLSLRECILERDPNGLWLRKGGGVLEYRTDSGTIWEDAGSLITAGQTYGGTLIESNALGDRQAFVAESFGYTASQLNLTSLAGPNVRFRFRVGSDPTVYDFGWFIDDIRIYQCVASSSPPVITSNGGGDTATVNVAENTTAVTTVTATDANGTTPTFGFPATGNGVDESFFTLTSLGVLTFTNAPDFETPQANSGDNTYEVVVEATDGLNSDTKFVVKRRLPCSTRSPR